MKSATNNTSFGGYTFAKVTVEPVVTEMNISSYFYQVDGSGNVSDATARLDPIANNSWFNGHTLSVIDWKYYADNRTTTLSNITYKEREGTITDNFVGNSYEIYFTEIEGYTLTKVN